MTRSVWLGVAVCFLLPSPEAASVRAADATSHYRLTGTLVDHTRNHGSDNRIWSPALCQKRDLYVYLPPGYDPSCRYPVMIWLHGIIRDERSSVDGPLRLFDQAMACGKMPPTIIAVPDGTWMGRPSCVGPRVLFLNSNAGNYEDYIVQDVWGFLQAHYPIRPEREAHVVGGYSGGGSAAYRIAIKHRDQFAVVFAISSPLNFRWIDCKERYFSDFDPSCWGWRDKIRTFEAVGRFHGIFIFRLGHLVHPLYGDGPPAVAAMSRENPIEMLDSHDVRPGQLAMFIAYGGKDEFNIGAQVESFLYRARERCLQVEVKYDPKGKHSSKVVAQFLPDVIAWLARIIPGRG